MTLPQILVAGLPFTARTLRYLLAVQRTHATAAYTVQTLDNNGTDGGQLVLVLHPSPPPTATVVLTRHIRPHTGSIQLVVIP